MNNIYFMNVKTGSVDTQENWIADGAEPQDFGDTIVPVQLADGSEVPVDFISTQSDDYEWVECE